MTCIIGNKIFPNKSHFRVNDYPSSSGCARWISCGYNGCMFGEVGSFITNGPIITFT